MSCQIFIKLDEKAVGFVESLPKEIYFLECNGKVFHNLDEIEDGKLIQLHYRMCGGKGGFGSLLRSFRIHKSSNQLMCRNLQGRRLADVKEEERLKKFIAKKAEREKEKHRKREEKIERLKAGEKTKHNFEDQNYLRKRDTILDEVEDAMEAGIGALEQKSAMAIQEKAADEDEPIAGCSSSGLSTEKQRDDEQPSTSAEVVESSDSDVDLDEVMSIGPMKKKKEVRAM